MIAVIIKQELRLIFKKFSNIINPVIFFFIAISIFAISFTNLADSNIHKQLNIAIIWFCLVFSILLGLNHSFKEDFEDGSMEQLFMSGYMFEIIIVGKIFANWIIYCLPLILAIPLLVMVLGIENQVILHLTLISIIVTLIINFIASFCAGLILSSGSGHSLLTILVLPLTIPVIIFANSAFSNNTDIAVFYSSLRFLLAILAFLVPILTFATAAVIRINLDD